MLYRNSDLWRLFAPDMSAKPNEVRELKDVRVKTMQKMANSHKENSNNISGTIYKKLDVPHHLGSMYTHDEWLFDGEYLLDSEIFKGSLLEVYLVARGLGSKATKSERLSKLNEFISDYLRLKDYTDKDMTRIDSKAKCCTKIVKECYPYYLIKLNSREINECNKFLKSIKK